MLDTFFERGGNFFDTAWQYEDGRAEERLGWWLETRGVRDEVAILDKGAHTPHCTPELLTLQHHESLERLRTDYVDLYMMHRDDVDIPVGEFVEVLNQHRKAGTMLAFGASNWTLPRVEEANRYASEHGLEGFSAISNQLSLARMEVPIWSGTLHAFDREWTDWLERNQAPLMAWSATARGFFVPGDVAFKADWGDRLPGEVHNHWNSEANFARRDRANELATRYGVAPVAIALAFVLHQRSPTFAVIGSRTIEELNISIEALGVDLSAAEVAWLRDGAVSASEA
jgi:aryl-alcohol dehydrogenase-like predicted oxidoreductase